MKKIKIFALTLFCLLLFTGCDIIVKKIEIAEYIVGTWYCEKSQETFVFNSDCTCMLIDGETIRNLTYKFNGEEVEIYNGITLYVKFTYVCGDAFTIRFYNNLNFTFYRIE